MSLGQLPAYDLNWSADFAAVRTSRDDYTVSYDAVLMPGSMLISSPVIVNTAVLIRLDLWAWASRATKD